MKKHLLFLKFLALGLTTSLYGQTCGTDELQQDFFRSNPQLKIAYEAKIREFIANRRDLNTGARVENETIEIPIVVHILDDGSGMYVPTEAQINSWINRANSIFDGTAQDIKGPGEGGTKLPVKLVLAKRTPECTSTNGIITHDLSSNATYVANGVANGSNKPGVPYSVINNTYNWDYNSYFNIYVTNKINGVNPDNVVGGSYTAGFATYPGYSTDLSVMLYHVVTNNNDTTFAHEMMHAFGIKHVFANDVGQDDGDGATCGGDINDGIADTQKTRSGLYFGNPWQTYNQYTTYPVTGTTINDCTGTPFDGVQHNMMNYGSRLDRFTPGQGEYAMDVIYAMRPSFLTSKGAKPLENNSLENPIAATCVPSGVTNVPVQEGYGYGMGIENFQLGSINVNSDTPRGGSRIYYTDYNANSCANTSHITELNIGESYIVKAGTSTPYDISYTIYIDYNNNGSFETSEKLNITLDLTSNGEWDFQTVSNTYIVPNNVILDTPLRMRVIGDYFYYNDKSPCGQRLYGEVEDYAVIFKDPNTTILENGTWSNGTPTITKNAIIRDVYEIANNASAKSIKTEIGGKVVVKSGYTLTVANEITNSNGAEMFVVESGANLLQLSDATNVGLATVYSNSQPMQRNDMTLWSSPVVGQDIRSFSPETLIHRFWTYNESARAYTPLFETEADAVGHEFKIGKGVAIRSRYSLLENEFDAYPGKFVGNLNNGAIPPVPVVYTTTGYNILGNPYPSSINTMDFLNTNPTISTIYFWTHQYPVGSLNYGNNYAIYTLAGPNTPRLDDNISVGQGFIIKTTQDANVVFNNSMRNNTTPRFQRNETIERNRIWLGFKENNTVHNDVLISYITGATNGFDNQYDGIRMQTGGSAMYTILDDEAYLVQGRALPFSTEDIIPLGFESPNGGTFEISITAKDGLFHEGQEVFLFDKLLNTIHNLTNVPYSFTSEAGIFNERFEVLFTNRSLDVKDLLDQDIKVFKDGNNLIVESLRAKIVGIELVDVQGRKVFSQSKLNTNRYQVNTSVKGVLIIKVETDNGQIKTQKILK